MKKKIIIVSHNLRLGGVERSLIGLLHAMDYSRFEVDLFLFLHDGELLKFLPKEVNLLPENKNYKGLLVGVKENLQLGNWRLLLQKYKAKKKSETFIRENQLSPENMVYLNYLQKYALPTLPQISDKNYDLAISFLTPHYIAAQKVKAQKRIAWIHTDYAYFEFDKKTEVEMWDAFDHIASISEDCSRGFAQQFPTLGKKIVLIENILDAQFVKEQAQEFSVEEEMPTKANELKLLSVGRFSHQKNFDTIPEIAHHLSEKGLEFKWYLIGYGSEENLIRQKITEWKQEDRVVILGKKENPYPYMAACDVYLQPSRYEGKAVTVREAQMLAKPVIITAFPTAQSQLKNEIDGLIVPMETRACAEAIFEVLNYPALLEQLKTNCSTRDFGNTSEIKKIEKIIL